MIGWQNCGEGLLYFLIAHDLWMEKCKYTKVHKKCNVLHLSHYILCFSVQYIILCFCQMQGLMFLKHFVSGYQTLCSMFVCVKFSSILILILLTPFFCFTNSVFICSINIVQNVRTAGELTSQFCFCVVEKTILSSSQDWALSVSYFILWCFICFTLPSHADYSFTVTATVHIHLFGSECITWSSSPLIINVPLLSITFN